VRDVRRETSIFAHSTREVPVKARELQKNWRSIQGQLRERFPKLTDEDMDRIRGDKDELLKCMEERYGKNRRQCLQDLNHFLEGLHAKA
jgi:uncharacterized protein YjbJ (UPF0337 family)